jgi:hypothetical protein
MIVQPKRTASVHTTEIDPGMALIAGLGYLEVWLDCAPKTHSLCPYHRDTVDPGMAHIAGLGYLEV